MFPETLYIVRAVRCPVFDSADPIHPTAFEKGASHHSQVDSGAVFGGGRRHIHAAQSRGVCGYGPARQRRGVFHHGASPRVLRLSAGGNPASEIRVRKVI